MGDVNPFAVIASIAEEKIREAQAEGAFDNLPGRGRPLQYEDDSGIPPDLRMAYKVLKNAGCLPPEEKKKVILNRPFVFAIVHGGTGLPVFTGIVNHLEETEAGPKRDPERKRQGCFSLWTV